MISYIAISSNFSKLLPSDTSEQELQKDVQFIESQGRYSGVRWQAKGDYIVLLSKEGKVLRPSKFVDYLSANKKPEKH